MSSAGQTQRAPGTGAAVLSLCLVQFVDVLGVTVVITSLPAMLASLHAPASYASLIATGYATFFGGLLMLGARLGDRFGHRRTIIASLAVFAAGAVLSATAADLALIPSAAAPLAVPACAAAAGAGIGLSSVAATGLGTDVAAHWRGSASGIINTAAQLGTAIGVAVLLLIAAATTGTPAARTPAPTVAWAVAAAVAAVGAGCSAIAGRRSPNPVTSGSGPSRAGLRGEGPSRTGLRRQGQAGGGSAPASMDG
jgi:MFS family permease